jgi:hypothetical protein
LLLHEGGQPVRLRACYLDDEELIALAQRAEALRAPWPGRHAELVWRLRGEEPSGSGP